MLLMSRLNCTTREQLQRRALSLEDSAKVAAYCTASLTPSWPATRGGKRLARWHVSSV